MTTKLKQSKNIGNLFSALRGPDSYAQGMGLAKDVFTMFIRHCVFLPDTYPGMMLAGHWSQGQIDKATKIAGRSKHYGNHLRYALEVIVSRKLGPEKGDTDYAEQLLAALTVQ